MDTDSKALGAPGEILISAEGVSKKFCRSLRQSLVYGLKDMTTEMLGRKSAKEGLRREEFWAVDSVHFELRRGECLGLIGRNGAGKTTLLKMLNGLIKPDRGSITMRGRVGALIALGAGFNPILTGRENIYVNASVLGIERREIDAKVDGILEFAGLQSFANTPVQNYSSGMTVRLGFAIATALKPDILLLDEVLAVGDAAFRMKCYNVIGKLLSSCAVIFVSHSMDQIARICTQSLALRGGKQICFGTPSEGIRAYEEENAWDSGSEQSFEKHADPVEAVDLTLPTPSLRFGDVLHLALNLRLRIPMQGANFRVQFYEEGIVASEAITGVDDEPVALRVGSQTVSLSVGPVHLRRGVYRLSVLALDARRQSVLAWSYRQVAIKVVSDDWTPCAYRMPVAASV